MTEVKVTFPSILSIVTHGEKEVTVEATVLKDVLNTLSTRYGKEFKERIFDQNKPRVFINIYVNGRDTRFTGGLETLLKEGDKISIFLAVSGG